MAVVGGLANVQAEEDVHVAAVEHRALSFFGAAGLGAGVVRAHPCDADLPSTNWPALRRTGRWSGLFKYLRQLGLYGFTGSALGLFRRRLPQGPLERMEGVEMLRFVEHGHSVRMLGVADEGVAVDTPEDLARARSLLG
ncbi:MULTISPECIES: glycosyltransferase family protein [Streptomyces]|uniref:hypothetical protein n=1 Tax=Streptomyces TaxID=1883 RepID=UPI001CCD85E7|nr:MULTISPECIES: hypothetical protein [Streptomyces]UBI41387.1 hypothetical protein K7I03_28725 [Streptomyces mobaraensis]UKW33883.1 hypothetical protein MCU78_28655 [Streptomyces sp. TYQ1024]